MRRKGRRRPAVLLMLAAVCLAGAPGCKRKRPPAQTAGAQPAPDAGAASSCPPSDAIARAFAEPGRSVRVGCHAFTGFTHWMAVVVSYADSGPAATRVQLVSGGVGPRMTAFDVPVPAAALDPLVRSGRTVEAHLRPSSSSLMRIGVTARRGDSAAPDDEEIAALLQLVAHKAPRLIWVGAGDRVTAEGGCVIERKVDFQSLFNSRIDMVTGTRARPQPGAKVAEGACSGGPGMQEPLAANPVALPPGRAVEMPAPSR